MLHKSEVLCESSVGWISWNYIAVTHRPEKEILAAITAKGLSLRKEPYTFILEAALWNQVHNQLRIIK